MMRWGGRGEEGDEEFARKGKTEGWVGYTKIWVRSRGRQQREASKGREGESVIAAGGRVEM